MPVRATKTKLIFLAIKVIQDHPGFLLTQCLKLHHNNLHPLVGKYPCYKI